MSVNVYAFKMAAIRFDVKNIRSYPGSGREARRAVGFGEKRRITVISERMVEK